jgi:membrane protease YdiL (CAAX protease family)
MPVIGSTGLLAPGKWRPLRALGWLAFLCVLIVITYNAVAKATLMLLAAPAGFDASAAPAAYKLVAAILGSIALIAAYWGAVRLGERRDVTELRLGRAPVDSLLGLGVGAGLLSAIVGILWLFGWVSIERSVVDRVALALRDSVRSGVLEELVLRLVIFRLLWRSFGIWPALVAAALLFGALHLANPDSGLFAAACLIAGEGVGIGLYLITGRIWASVGMHAGWNFMQGWVFGAAVSGITDISGGPLIMKPVAGVPDVLSGGGFGPEASLAALMISLIASAAFLYRAWSMGRFVADDG